MAAHLFRILALIAVVLMPFGMAAPAAAGPAGSQHHMQMAQGHFDDDAPVEDASDHLDQCATACAMMLPDSSAFAQNAGEATGTARWQVATPPVGSAPEMDPPPPKHA